jgi:hypothetical protein
MTLLQQSVQTDVINTAGFVVFFAGVLLVLAWTAYLYR